MRQIERTACRATFLRRQRHYLLLGGNVDRPRGTGVGSPTRPRRAGTGSQRREGRGCRRVQLSVSRQAGPAESCPRLLALGEDPRRLSKSIALLVAVGLSILATGGPKAALAHEEATSTVQGHVEEDSVAHSPAEERRLGRRTRAATAADAEAAAAAVTATSTRSASGACRGLAGGGRPRGAAREREGARLRLGGDNGTETYPVQDHTRATVWDPATGTQTPVWVTTGYNIFCSGLAHLMDGSLFVAGGNKDAQFDGHRPDAHLRLGHGYVEPWAEHGGGRWYPSVTPGQRGDADHGGRARHAGGAQDRRRPAHAQHGLAQPPALPVDRRGARWRRLLLGPRPDPAEPRHSRRRVVAKLQPARHPEPRLRQPRAL